VMGKYFLGFLFGVVATSLLIDRGVNLPDRLQRVVNTGEVQRLWEDIVRSTQ